MSYELVIGTKNWSSWSLRAWLALKGADVPFAEKLIALRRPETADRIKAVSASMRIPVLHIAFDDVDVSVFDSLAICEVIAERHPEAALWPGEPQARYLARAYSAEMHSGFLALREALPMDFARMLPTPAIDEEVERQIRRIQQAWCYALSRHGSGEGFLFGRFSIADCMYAPVVSRFHTYQIPMAGDAQDYVERIMALPAMREWYEAAAVEVEAGLPDQWMVDMVRNAR